MKTLNGYEKKMKETYKIGMKAIRREVCRIAHYFITENGMNQSDAMQIAWANAVLRNNLHHKTAVRFTFMKKDGTTRQAVGTLCGTSSWIGYYQEKANDEFSEKVQKYFDLEKHEWRCFKRENLVAINEYNGIMFFADDFAPVKPFYFGNVLFHNDGTRPAHIEDWDACECHRYCAIN